MVAAADLGVCMHMSSSNLDLPMKVVDMFSCKVPCLAFEYPTIGELVHSEGHEKPNGALFKTDEQLLGLLLNLFSDGLEDGLTKIQKWSSNLDRFTAKTWETHWQEVMIDGGRGVLVKDDPGFVKTND